MTEALSSQGVGPKILTDDLPGFDSIRSTLDGTWERFARRSVSE